MVGIVFGVDKEFHGKGVLTYKNGGNKYEGHWKNDLRHGKGVHTFSNGQKVEGNWNCNKCNGEDIKDIEIRIYKKSA